MCCVQLLYDRCLSFVVKCTKTHLAVGLRPESPRGSLAVFEEEDERDKNRQGMGIRGRNGNNSDSDSDLLAS